MSAPSLPSLLVSHWRLEPALAGQAVLYAGLYLYGTTRAHNGWPRARTLCFLGGIATVLTALGSGIDSYDDRLLSVHMVQHMLLLLIAPLLLLSGRPALLALKALPGGARRPLARALSRLRPFTGPAQCLTVFYAAVLITHLPSFYDSTLSQPALHDAEHGVYLIAGLLLWWPLLDADPTAARRLSGVGKLIYLILAMVPMALIGAYLNRHVPLVYPDYAAPARVLGVGALSDQAEAGAIMWVIGNTIMVTVGLWVALAALVASERRQQAREAHAR